MPLPRSLGSPLADPATGEALRPEEVPVEEVGRVRLAWEWWNTCWPCFFTFNVADTPGVPAPGHPGKVVYKVSCFRKAVEARRLLGVNAANCKH